MTEPIVDIESNSLATITTPECTINQLELERRVAKAAGGFEDIGVGNGGVVALLMRNDIPFIEAYIATQKAGAYSVPVNWHSTPIEIEYVLKDCAATLLIVHADLYRTIADRIPAGCTILIASTPDYIQEAFKLAKEDCATPEGMTDWRQWIEEQNPRIGPDAPQHGAIIYTSGTTGKPKGVKRLPMAPDLLARNIEVFRKTYGLAPDVRALMVTPLYHASPNGFARYTAINGELLVLLPRFDAEDFLRQIEKYKINTITVVPTIFIKLLKLPKEVRDRYDTSSLKWVSHTASACPVEVKQEMIKWWGPILHEVYGGTETGIALHCTSEEWLRKPGTVGHCIKGCEIRIYSETGQILPVGTSGEIFVKNTAYADFTYINLPEERAAVDRDGFVSIGDIGYLDDDGYLFISDRKRDMVIFGGTNIYPAEIESALILHEKIADCAVIGIPDDEFGEVVAAYIKPVEGVVVTEEDLNLFLAEKIAKYKIPRSYIFVNNLPREESGKLMKRKLRDLHISN
uniref:3-methylmercaptopropionyl-CoA ligase n=1 Tax=OCS116 cluster bacterium TaxID=2030921 RepID=A0A2A4YZP4_9PROT